MSAAMRLFAVFAAASFIVGCATQDVLEVQSSEHFVSEHRPVLRNTFD